jgi:hypothetical protein
LPTTKLHEITAENYQRELAVLEGGLRRFGATPAKSALGSMGALAEGIGTLLWQFGEPQAPDWLGRALTFYRQSVIDPTIKVALLLWKLNDVVAFRAECERVIEFHDRRLEDAEAGRLDLPEFQRVRAQREPAFAHYLLGSYERARGRADQALEFGWEKRTAGGMTALKNLVEGLMKRDGMGFVRGLEILRSSFPRWPTASSSIEDDFYRYNLALGAKHFPDETRMFEPFGNGQGRGVELSE